MNLFRIDSLSVEFETPLDDPSHFKSNLEDMSELKSPKSPLEALDDALDLVMPSARFSIPIPPPRNKQKSGEKLKCKKSSLLEKLKII